MDDDSGEMNGICLLTSHISGEIEEDLSTSSANVSSYCRCCDLLVPTALLFWMFETMRELLLGNTEAPVGILRGRQWRVETSFGEE